MERFFVFARTEYDEPLEHRGDVEASDGEEAGKLARERYGEDWLEMSLVPVSQVYWAEREEETEVGVQA
jgi:1,2-phenylacetyl-CoA epoxidase PaaB subunit